MKILFDLSSALCGHSGIPHDSRLIFAMLRDLDSIQVSGLIYPRDRSSAGRVVSGASNEVTIATTLFEVAHPVPAVPAGNLAMYSRWISDLWVASRGRHEIVKVPDWLSTDVLWRLIFEKTMKPLSRERVTRGEFFITDLSRSQLLLRSHRLKRLPPKVLDIGDHDVLWLPMPSPLAVQHGITKVVRYHDAVPLTQPDTLAHALAPFEHFEGLKACRHNSIFVCNSPMSRDVLASILPDCISRSVVIPCAVSSSSDVSILTKTSLAQIFRRRVSYRALGGNSGKQQNWSDRFSSSGRPRYIIGVSTLEPRKNLAALIEAWERLRAMTSQEVLLVLVANVGWGDTAATLAAMRPYVGAGDLIHLEKLTAEELEAVYREAEMCVALPFDEGFGFVPLEALQAGIPVVASDIPTFRWTLGEAALFADPYDHSAAADCMARLLDEPANKSLRAHLRAQAAPTLARFSTATVKAQWDEFFRETLPQLREQLSRTPASVPSPASTITGRRFRNSGI